MQEIKYETKGPLRICTTDCPNKMRDHERYIAVGSIVCGICRYHKFNDRKNNVVTCKYGDENVKI
jgi:hypothetical protein